MDDISFLIIQQLLTEIAAKDNEINMHIQTIVWQSMHLYGFVYPADTEFVKFM